MALDYDRPSFRANRIFIRLDQPYYRGLDEVIAQILDHWGVLVETDAYYRCLFPFPDLSTIESSRLKTWLTPWHFMDTEPLGSRGTELVDALRNLSFVTEIIVGQDEFEAYLDAQKKFLAEDDPESFL